jgi:hypothetical protein
MIGEKISMIHTSFLNPSSNPFPYCLREGQGWVKKAMGNWRMVILNNKKDAQIERLLRNQF